jgi:hypothetical protein
MLHRFFPLRGLSYNNNNTRSAVKPVHMCVTGLKNGLQASVCALQEKTISRGGLFPPGGSKIPFSLNNKGT